MSTCANQINQNKMDMIKLDLQTLVGKYKPKLSGGNDDPTVSTPYMTLSNLKRIFIYNLKHLQRITLTEGFLKSRAISYQI